MTITMHMTRWLRDKRVNVIPVTTLIEGIAHESRRAARTLLWTRVR